MGFFVITKLYNLKSGWLRRDSVCPEFPGPRGRGEKGSCYLPSLFSLVKKQTLTVIALIVYRTTKSSIEKTQIVHLLQVFGKKKTLADRDRFHLASDLF